MTAKRRLLTLIFACLCFNNNNNNNNNYNNYNNDNNNHNANIRVRTLHSINFLSYPFPSTFINRTIFFRDALATLLFDATQYYCHFPIVIDAFLYQRAKPPEGTVLFINILAKWWTPTACMGDGDSI